METGSHRLLIGCFSSCCDHRTANVFTIRAEEMLQQLTDLSSVSHTQLRGVQVPLTPALEHLTLLLVSADTCTLVHINSHKCTWLKIDKRKTKIHNEGTLGTELYAETFVPQLFIMGKKFYQNLCVQNCTHFVLPPLVSSMYLFIISPSNLFLCLWYQF